ncbi:conserved unknown protein [Ectocarpus siliculosus]|uniref:PX domain-containing protein n=1 Tax=Ectocarpus siliculosus TaxID=2880 RepID=D7FHG1_ECTSI|nr:conserved unknown protein [Ectocarpus siliculosus]|eukprot:CBJ28523.1 conserved unknown protein [Ectocarpus siliculosus]
MDTMLPPLGEGLPLHSSLRQVALLDPPPPLSSVASRDRPHLEPIRTTKLNDDAAESSSSSGGIAPKKAQEQHDARAASGTTTALLSPPTSPPRLCSISPTPSRGVPKMGSMDDSYCDRYRSTSSFGWYEETAAFESMDAPQSKAFCQVSDWRNLETWDGGRHEPQEEAATVEFVVPNAQVTTTKTFRQGMGQQPEPYAVSIGSTRVRRLSPFAVHAEYQVLVSTKDQVHKSWKRYSDFKLLAEYAKISDLRDTVKAWAHIQQTQRWFRCLEANYLKTKCSLLERFLAQFLFEVPTPSLLMNFVGAQQPGFVRRR